MYNIYPNRLKELRLERKLTLEEVGKIVEYNYTTVSKHESGKIKLPDEVVEKYSKLYKVPTHHIFMEPVDNADTGIGV